MPGNGGGQIPPSHLPGLPPSGSQGSGLEKVGAGPRSVRTTAARVAADGLVQVGVEVDRENPLVDLKAQRSLKLGSQWSGSGPPSGSGTIPATKLTKMPDRTGANLPGSP